MTTETNEIRCWFEEGKRIGATHMLLLRDSYGCKFPYYVFPGQHAHEVATDQVKKPYLFLMGVFASHLSLEDQLEDQLESPPRFHYESASAPTVSAPVITPALPSDHMVAGLIQNLVALWKRISDLESQILLDAPVITAAKDVAYFTITAKAAHAGEAEKWARDNAIRILQEAVDSRMKALPQ